MSVVMMQTEFVIPAIYHLPLMEPSLTSCKFFNKRVFLSDNNERKGRVEGF